MKRTSGCRKYMSGLAMLVALVAGTSAADAQVRISQIYGGGGNANAIYLNDYIELFNAGSTPVDLTGLSVQYGAQGGTTWQLTVLPAVMLQPGQYILIQEASGGANGVALPTPDATGTINMSATGGKVALVNGVTALSGACPTSGIIDLIGFGATANCFEGATRAPAGSNTTSLFRASGGCQDTDNNGVDFAPLAPAPRNTATPAAPCQPATNPSGSGASSPADPCLNETVTLTVTVTPGMFPTSTGLSVVGDTTNIGGGPGVAFLDDGMFPDAMAGDNIFTAQATIGPATQFGARSVSATISDAQGRTGNAGITVTVLNCNITGFGSSTPPGACEGDPVLLTVDVNPGIRPDSTGVTVVVDVSGILGESFAQTFYDDATHGDLVANDTIFSYGFNVPVGQPAGTVMMVAIIQDAQFRVNTATINFTPVPECVNSTSSVVISQVYGGGGNNGGVWRNDYIELFNRSSLPVDITGWSVQYGSGSSPVGFMQKTDLTGIIPAGGYYLVQEAAGADMNQPLLPVAPDATGTLMLGATAGRVALVRDGVLIDIDCAAPTVEDLVAYGNVVCFEGIDNGPTLTNATGVYRANAGCRDTNQNVADLYEGAPVPRNSASPLNLCNPPVTGACCLTDGSCISTTAADCATQSGTYNGDGVLCGNVMCPQPPVNGACCLADGSCVFTTSANCATQNGTYNGDGVLCGSVMCPPPVVCPCDWNHDSVLNSQDFFDFIAAFFGAGADFNMDNQTNSQDFFDFLSCFFAPPMSCP